MSRTKVAVWGMRGALSHVTESLDYDVCPRKNQTALDTLARRIARSVQCECIASVSNGQATEKNHVVSDHYQLTFGYWSKKANAYNVVASCFVAIYR